MVTFAVILGGSPKPLGKKAFSFIAFLILLEFTLINRVIGGRNYGTLFKNKELAVTLKQG